MTLTHPQPRFQGHRSFPSSIAQNHAKYTTQSTLLTVNIVLHNPAQSCSDNIPSLPPDSHHNLDVVKWRRGEQTYTAQLFGVNQCTVCSITGLVVQKASLEVDSLEC